VNKLLLITLFVFCQSAFAFDCSAYPIQDIDKFVDEERPNLAQLGALK